MKPLDFLGSRMLHIFCLLLELKKKKHRLNYIIRVPINHSNKRHVEVSTQASQCARYLTHFNYILPVLQDRAFIKLTSKMQSLVLIELSCALIYVTVKGQI